MGLVPSGYAAQREKTQFSGTIGGSETMNLAELIVARCELQPHALAVRSGPARLTYGDLGRSIEQRARMLRRCSLPGDVILLTPVSLDCIPSYVAALLVGRLASLGDATDRSSATAVVAGGEFVRLVDPVNGLRVEGGVVLLTSGTTGRPKRVLHGLDGLASSLLNTVSVEAELTGEDLRVDPSDLAPVLTRSPHGLGLLCGMPIRSVAGLSMLNRALAMGETLVLSEATRPHVLWSELRSADVTNAGIPPIAVQGLLRAAQLNGWHEPGLLSLGVGGAKVDADLACEVESQFGCPVTAGYGSTELGGVALMSRPWDPPQQRWQTVGRPIGAVEVRLEAVGDGMTELVVRSPAAMVGTLSEDNRLQAATEWIRTGDSVSMSADGALCVEGRLDYVIQRGGRRIDPARIEAVIRAHPAVAAAGVVGQPSRIAGEEDVWALAELTDPEAAREVLHHCRQRLEPFEVPRRILVVEAIPLTHDGTPRRSELPALLRQARLAG